MSRVDGFVAHEQLPVRAHFPQWLVSPMQVSFDDLHGLKLVQADVSEFWEPQITETEHDEVVSFG